MTASTTIDPAHDDPVEQPRVRPQRWWLELPLAVAFYALYAEIRDLHGDATEHSRLQAQHNGFRVLDVERFFHIDAEHAVQHLFLESHALIVGLDIYYDTFHFVLTLLVFVGLMIWASPQRFRRCRNIFAIGTLISLIVFAFFPTMPPRLMPPGIKTIDTAAVYGGLFSYNNGSIEHIADGYAAMPSLHIVWSTWVAYAMWSTRRTRSKIRYLWFLYPLLTSTAVIATGVHWTLDVIAGAVVFFLSLGIEALIERWLDRRPARRSVVDEADGGQTPASGLTNA